MRMHEIRIFHRHSLIKQIRYMVVLMVAVMVLILAMVIVWFFFHHRNTVMDYADMLLRVYAENTENELERFEQGIFVFLSDEEFQESVKTICDEQTGPIDFVRAHNHIEDKITNLYTQFEYLNEYAVFDLEGNRRMSLGFASDKGVESEVFGFTRDFLSKKQMMDYIISQKRENSLLFVCNIVDVYATGYRVIGYMAFSINTQRLMGVFSRARVFGGQFIVRKEDVGGVIGGAILDQDFLHELQPEKGYSRDITSFDGRRFFISSSSNESDRFSYQLIVPMEEIDGANIRFLAWVALCILVVLFLAVLFVAVSLYNVLSPVRRMQKDLAIVENGGFQVMEEKEFDPDSENEIDILHRNFCQSIQRLQKSIEEKQKYQELLKEEQLKQLQLQMNPHFLYNTLDILYWDALAEGSDNTAEMIHCMGKMFRYATDLKRDVVALSEEVELLKAYATICRQRYRNRLEIGFEIEDAFYPVKIPKFSVQPLLENAINATIRAQLVHCLVIVGARKQEGAVEVYVRDNGKGIEEQAMEAIRRGEAKSKDTGIALYNIHQRLQYLFGKESGIFTGEIDGMKAVGFRIRIDS